MASLDETLDAIDELLGEDDLGDWENEEDTFPWFDSMRWSPELAEPLEPVEPSYVIDPECIPTVKPAGSPTRVWIGGRLIGVMS